MKKEEIIINKNGKAFNGNVGAVLVAAAAVGLLASFAIAEAISSIWRSVF